MSPQGEALSRDHGLPQRGSDDYKIYTDFGHRSSHCKHYQCKLGGIHALIYDEKALIASLVTCQRLSQNERHFPTSWSYHIRRGGWPSVVASLMIVYLFPQVHDAAVAGSKGVQKRVQLIHCSIIHASHQAFSFCPGISQIVPPRRAHKRRRSDPSSQGVKRWRINLVHFI